MPDFSRASCKSADDGEGNPSGTSGCVITQSYDSTMPPIRLLRYFWAKSVKFVNVGKGIYHFGHDDDLGENPAAGSGYFNG
jgi:hypothetical protein